MLLENVVTRRVSEENASKSSLTRRVTKQGHLLLAALVHLTLFWFALLLSAKHVGDRDPNRKVAIIAN